MHTAARFAEKRSTTLPVLSSILILSAKDGIKLRATNLEIGIDLTLNGECKEEGVAAVPAAILQQITSSLVGEGIVRIEKSGEMITLASGNGKSTIKTVPYEDFPSIPFPENPKNRIVVSGAAIKNLFSSITSCASTSNVRPELASISISISGGSMTAVATDSFRLAEKKIGLSHKGSQSSFLIPAKNALDIAQALPDEEIILSFDEHQCALVSDARMMVSRLTNAVYPDYQQIIPKEIAAEATILRKDFESALKRTTVFSDAFQRVRLSFDPKGKRLSLFARNADIGESTEVLNGNVSGSALELSFNHRYLSAVLALTNAESLSFSAAGVGRPLIMRGSGDNSLLYLVSPMNQ